ncbi:hypothetical protein AR457_40225 [Streptomyces agglomeratus]|uniref:hypothetical protein n=1 Tax=Streptomyces agglomeratus TaxID=285458 RepID=UPI0008527C1B|nr:hypothetical protein [Streptomyces agglomeratus]OEJ22116.1 hypothetical protein AR457_40225 [Streptomyces agglomeratus]OEJ36953.1 hypothetical protein BGK70_00880 [Streptomyces agglomeratus]
MHSAAQGLLRLSDVDGLVGHRAQHVDGQGWVCGFHLGIACNTWRQVLDAMTGVQSAQAREAVVQMSRALSPFRNRAGGHAAELDAKAQAVLQAS